MIESGLIASRFLHYLAVFVLFGAALFPDYALDRGFPAHRAAAKRVSRLIVPAALAALATAILWFLFTTAGMAGDIGAIYDPQRLALVAGTEFGHVWAFHIALATALVLAAFRQRLAPWRAALMLGSGVLVASIARTGHAIEGDGAILHSLADAVHLLAAAIWIGALAALTMMAGLARRDIQDAHALSYALTRFSALGPWLVTVIVLTGLANSWVLVGPAHVRELASSRYGAVLLMKIALFGAMLAFAAVHRLVLAPRLEASRSHATTKGVATRLCTSLALEGLLGILVLVAVGWLGTLPYPAGL